MSKYEYSHDNEHEDKEEDNYVYDDWRPVVPVHSVQTIVDAPVTTTVSNVVNVVVNPPTVQLTNNIVIVTEQIENKVLPPAPKPITTNYMYGTSKKDYLVGTNLDDVIYGYQGNDTLIDGTGTDKLYGAKGKNKYACTSDGQIDFVYITKDKQPDIITSIGIEDRINISGSKFTFIDSSKGIEIYLKHQLQVIYTGNILSLADLQSITV